MVAAEGIGTTCCTVSGKVIAATSDGLLSMPISPVRNPCCVQASFCNSGSVSAVTSRLQIGVSEISGCEAKIVGSG